MEQVASLHDQFFRHSRPKNLPGHLSYLQATNQTITKSHIKYQVSVVIISLDMGSPEQESLDAIYCISPPVFLLPSPLSRLTAFRLPSSQPIQFCMKAFLPTSSHHSQPSLLRPLPFSTMGRMITKSMSRVLGHSLVHFGSLGRSAALIRSLARSRTRSGVREKVQFLMSQNHAVLNHSEVRGEEGRTSSKQQRAESREH